MNCACRTAALRLFVRSVAQLHISEAGSSRLASLSRPPASLRARLAASWSSAATTRRRLHSSTTRRRTSPDGAPQLAGEHYNAERGPEKGSQAGPAEQSVAEQQTGEVGNLSNTEPSSRPLKKYWGFRRPFSPVPSERKPRPRADDSKTTTAQRPVRQEQWQVQKDALKDKFPEGWKPRKRLSPDALEGIRALHAQFPEEYTTEVLADKFEVSPEAIRRILKSSWRPSPEQEIERQERWFERGKQIWGQWAELGKKPPQRWRKEGIVRARTRRHHNMSVNEKLAKNLL